MAKTCHMSDWTRRELLQRASALAVAGTLPAGVMAALAPKRTVQANDKIVFGLIGCGGMGASNMRTFMNHPEVEIAALCDVDENRIPGDFKAVSDKYGKKPEIYRDYRKMLERKDVDAVIVGSPDHWHALHFIHACQAGKDSYCEKPVSHNIVEALAMAEAAKKYKRVVQVGTWQRSTKEFTDAIAFIRAGKLGKVVLCRAWITDGFKAGVQKASTPPAGLDYDAWIGPATMVPYKPNHVHFNWRWFMNTGGGMSTDWGVHMMDIALLGMSKDQNLVMPDECTAVGGNWAITGDDRDAPDVTEAIYRFSDPDFAMHWSIGRDHPGKPGHGTEFVSADGRTLRVWRGGWQILDADGKELPKEESPDVGDHWKDFLNCVVSRGKPRADFGSVAQTTIVCHLANVALQSGRTVKWDHAKNDLGQVGRDTAAYRREYRKPYSLPKV